MQNIINKVNNLPIHQQIDCAFFWEQELENELGFDEKLFKDTDKLSVLAANAVLEFEKGETVEKGFDEL